MAMTRQIAVALSHRTASLLFCVALLAVALPKHAEAQDWKFEPKFRVGGEYDDNADLAFRTDEEIQSTGYLVDLRADIFYTSPTTSFSLQPRAVIRNYSDESQFDSDDYYLRSQLAYRGQKITMGYRFNFDEESVRTAEQSNVDLEIDDPDDITDDTTGRVFLSGTRDRLFLQPYWDYQLSNISTLGASIGYTDVGYSGLGASALLADYSDVRLSLNYRRTFSRVNTGLLTVTARRFDPDAAADDRTGYGIQGGFSYAFSEKTRVRALFGLESIEQIGSDDDLEPVGSITVTRTLQTIRMFAQYRRSAGGSGSGRLTLRDSFSLNFDRRLNERISAGLGVRAYQSTATGGVDSIDDRNYVQIQSRFRWFLTRSFIAEAEYSYTISDFSDIPGIGGSVGERANSNRVGIWFVYQPKTTPRLQ